jgi:hypothetical protein
MKVVAGVGSGVMVLQAGGAGSFDGWILGGLELEVWGFVSLIAEGLSVDTLLLCEMDWMVYPDDFDLDGAGFFVIFKWRDVKFTRTNPGNFVIMKFREH